MFLSDNNQQLLFYEGFSKPSVKIEIKDIGPQIDYRLVYILEYLGPLLLTLFFFIRYIIIFKKLNQAKEICFNIIIYFLMSIFHYGKRLVESIFVHIFSRSTMPLKNLFFNCTYYWGIYGILCCYTLFSPYSTDIKSWKISRYFFVLFFFSAELKNLKTHLILRDIKIRTKGRKYLPPLMDGFE